MAYIYTCIYVYIYIYACIYIYILNSFSSTGILTPSPEIGGLSSWTRPRGSELVDPSLGALASICMLSSEIGGPRLP